MLNDYLKQTQRFIRDQRMKYIGISDLISYVNRGRREVAMRTQCIRVLTPISGAIQSWIVTAGGKSYTSSPTCVITPPDFPGGGAILPSGKQATATATVENGVIVNINNTYGGAGYFSPVMTITDSTGSGAAATAVLSPINILNQGQEQYSFANAPLSQFPGVKEIYFVRSASVIYSNYRYSLPCYAFSVYQSMIRQYPFQYQYVPTFCAQFGQGAGGSLFVYPIPSQTYQWEWDCCCLPIDLADDQAVEIIPDPWTDAVPYFAAAMAYEELQNLNAAKYYHDQFNQRTLNYSNYARVGKTVNPYGRY